MVTVVHGDCVDASEATYAFARHRGPNAGDVARAYGESFREFLLELSNSELEGDVLVVRVGGEEKRVKVGDYVDRVVEEVRSYVNLINKRKR
jgi:hypothetical protein